MTCVAEVCRSEAEENRDGTAVATLILEKVHSMFWAHLEIEEELR